MLGFLVFVGSCILVGWFAQVKRGRTGALWAFLTCIPGALIWYSLTLASEARAPLDPDAIRELQHPGLSAFATGTLCALIAGVITGAIVWTLPKPRGWEPAPPAEVPFKRRDISGRVP